MQTAFSKLAKKCLGSGAVYNNIRSNKSLRLAIDGARWFKTERSARRSFSKNASTEMASVYDPRLAEIQESLATDRFVQLTRQELALGQAKLPKLDEVAEENVRSHVFDPEHAEDVVSVGRGSDDVYQYNYQLSAQQIENIMPAIVSAGELLSNSLGMNFNCRYLATYRTVPFEHEAFQSTLWHIDYVAATPYEYKMMLLLDDVTEKNGPMLLSDLRLNRRLRSKANYRMSDKYVERNSQRISACVGKAGDAYLFSTDMVHKGGRVLEGCRDVVVVSYLPGTGDYSDFEQNVDAVGRSKLSAEIDPKFQ